ncbi:MAG TPA: class I adenylate-forming enzyme family protein [Hyphomicrobiales bacterium]|nr:class I adenylate-forming enzyme family protein [Hyphomicrobiales bacterium]
MNPLRDILRAAPDSSGRWLNDPAGTVPLAEIAAATCLGTDAAVLAGRSVVLVTGRQRAAVMALVALDGLVRRLVLVPPDIATDRLGTILADATADAIVTDRDPAAFAGFGVPVLEITWESHAVPEARHSAHDTEWVLLTSGTTGPPKLVVHSREGLTGAIAPPRPGDAPPVWGTFYDIRRYGGLQILFRALLGTGSLVLADAAEPVADHLARLGAQGVTHLSGTPSQWRRALMSPAIGRIAPRYVRLSGEIADQAVLDALRRAFPDAAIGHAYASTEAGVGFEVTDGREGFPAALVHGSGPVAMKVVDGSLRLRSTRTATRYVKGGMALADADGFVDSGDMVEQRGDRFFFAGRRGGIVNVGGLKVHPEEVEAAINRHDAVRMSLVRARPSPITGAIVVADVVLADGAGTDEAALKRDIVAFCRGALPPHKVPAQIRFVPALAMAPTGKIARHG